jgi:hypothetical protein
MSYDYNFPEGLRIADINNNRKVGTIDRRFIQSGNNVASGFARPHPFPLGSPAMGGRNIFQKISSGLKRAVTDPVGFTEVLVGPPVTSSNFKGDPNNPFGGYAPSGGRRKRGFNIGNAFKSIGNKAVEIASPVITKLAQQHLEKALTAMLESTAESAAEGAGVTGGKRGFKAFAKSIISHPEVKAFASATIKTITPHIKAVAERMLNATIQRLSEHGSEGMEGMEGAGFLDFGRRFGDAMRMEGDMAEHIATHGTGGRRKRGLNIGSVFKSIGNKAVEIASPVITKLAQQHLEKALTSMLESTAESAAEGAGMTGGKRGIKSYAKNLISHPAVSGLASQAVMVVAPVMKQLAERMLNHAVQMAMGAESAGATMSGGSFLGSLKHIGQSLGHVAQEVGTGIAGNYIASALMNPAVDEAILEGALVAAPVVAEAAGRGRRPRGRPRRNFPMEGGSIGSFFKKVGHTLGDAGKSVATGVGTQYLVNALTNPAVDEALAEGAMVALGRRPRGRPRKATGGFNLSGAIHSVTKQVPYGRGKAKGGLAIMNPDGSFRQINNEIGSSKRKIKLFGGAGLDPRSFTPRGRLGADPATYTPRNIGGIGVGFTKSGKMFKATDVARGGARSGGARGAIVSRIMKERGCSLPQASSIVKAEGLY